MEIDLDSLLSVGNMDESGAAGIPQLNEFLNNEEETKRNNFMERTRNFCVNQASSEQKLKHKFFKTNSLKLSRNALKVFNMFIMLLRYVFWALAKCLELMKYCSKGKNDYLALNLNLLMLKF